MAKKEKNYKCRYAHCKHETKDVPASIAVKENTMYYHKDCLEEKNTVNEIVSLFMEKVNRSVPASQVRKVVNDIVYNKLNDAAFLLFGLKYFIANKKLNYPGGLYYVVNDKDVNREWKKRIDSEFAKKTRDAFIVGDSDEEILLEPTYKRTNTGFSSVLGG